MQIAFLETILMALWQMMRNRNTGRLLQYLRPDCTAPPAGSSSLQIILVHVLRVANYGLAFKQTYSNDRPTWRKFICPSDGKEEGKANVKKVSRIGNFVHLHVVTRTVHRPQRRRNYRFLRPLALLSQFDRFIAHQINGTERRRLDGGLKTN